MITLLVGLLACGSPQDGSSAADSASRVDAVAAREAAAPGEVLVEAERWHFVDSSVDTAGLDVRFPDADGRDEVHLWEGEPPYSPGGIGPTRSFHLGSEAETYQVSWRGVTFEVRARAIGGAEGAELSMGVESAPEDGRLAGKLEMEDPAGAGHWIEIESARLLKAADR